MIEPTDVAVASVREARAAVTDWMQQTETKLALQARLQQAQEAGPAERMAALSALMQHLLDESALASAAILKLTQAQQAILDVYRDRVGEPLVQDDPQP